MVNEKEAVPGEVNGVIRRVWTESDGENGPTARLSVLVPDLGDDSVDAEAIINREVRVQVLPPKTCPRCAKPLPFSELRGCWACDKCNVERSLTPPDYNTSG